VATVAHQLHGALGTAREHELHRHTLGLWTWREEFGAEHYWARRLATDALAAPTCGAWLAQDAISAECRRSAVMASSGDDRSSWPGGGPHFGRSRSA